MACAGLWSACGFLGVIDVSGPGLALANGSWRRLFVFSRTAFSFVVWSVSRHWLALKWRCFVKCSLVTLLE